MSGRDVGDVRNHPNVTARRADEDGAREMFDAGVVVVLPVDRNPGAGPGVTTAPVVIGDDPAWSPAGSETIPPVRDH